MRRTYSVRSVGFVALSFLVWILAACDGTGALPWSTSGSGQPATSSSENAVRAQVARVIDGDTILLEDGTRVRYIGVNTPETVHPKKPVEYFGKEASAENRRLVEGKTVLLEYDVERLDRYGRTLAYVWLGKTLINGHLVKNGFATVTLYPPNMKYATYLKALESEAKQNGRGLWAVGSKGELTGNRSR